MSDRINERAHQILVEDLPKAKAITQKRLKDRHMGAESVWAQLDFIEGFVKARKRPSTEEIESITLNAFCGKELDGQDEEWSDLIGSVGAQFELLSQPEREDFHEGPWRRLKTNLPKAFEMTHACLKLHPNHPLFLGVMDDLKFIEQVHRQHRKPTYEERAYLTRSLSSVRFDEPARSMNTYVSMMRAVKIDWTALCEAPERCFDPDQDGSLYPDIQGL